MVGLTILVDARARQPVLCTECVAVGRAQVVDLDDDGVCSGNLGLAVVIKLRN